jgi:hypothetical protein
MTKFHDKIWHQQYEKLVEFKRNNGHCLVPQGYQKDVSFGMWVNTQRQFYSKNKLRLDRKVLLDELGFVWKVGNYALESIWKKHYEQLVEFKQKNGHCIVGANAGCIMVDEENKALGKWVSNQRERHRNNKMRLDRKNLLDELGFGWSVAKPAPNAAQRPNDLGSRWHKQYEKLVEFKRKNGHCSVPTRTYQEDLSLGKWVSNQRQMHVSNTLRLDRKELLDELGFAWKRGAAGNNKKETDETWNKQYEKLVEFKQNNGLCLVPNKYKEDVALGNWVNTQRQIHSNKELRLDRTGLLEELGFAWEVSTAGADNKQHVRAHPLENGISNCPSRNFRPTSFRPSKEES